MELQVQIIKKLPEFTLDISFNSGILPLGILGASGSGKSMLLKCIAGLETPDEGKIILNNRVLFDSEKKINLPPRARKVSILFQDYALFPHLTVAQNIAFGLNHLTTKAQQDIVKEIIAMVQMSGLEQRYPGQLSGGQKQRVALARALAVNPEAILLDEPLSALDNHLQSQMLTQLEDTLRKYCGLSLLVTHNLEEVYRLTHKLIILSKGKVAAAGCKEELFLKPPNVVSAKLTGCKNISRAIKLTEELVEAVDWGCTLKVQSSLPEDIEYVGIRAYHLKLTHEDGVTNSFGFSLDNISYGPKVNLISLELNPLQNKNSSPIQVEVPTEYWNSIKDRFPFMKVQFSPQNLFFMVK